MPENNYETMIREFMKSHSKRDFALITNVSDKFLEELKEKNKGSDVEAIKAAGYDVVTPVVISNTDKYLDVLAAEPGEVDTNSTLITLLL